MKKITVFVMVALIASMVLGNVAREALAFTWRDFEKLCRKASVQEFEAVFKQENLPVNAAQEDGTTLLMVALKNEARPENILFLLRAGARVNVKNSWGKTPLHFALQVHEPDPNVIITLLNAGANPNEPTDGGDTPISDAIRFTSQSFKETSAFNLLVQKSAEFEELAKRAKVNALIEAFSKRSSVNQAGAFGPDLTGEGLLQLGTYYNNLLEIYHAGSLINPILYENGNRFDLEIKVYAFNTESPLMTFSYPAPTYVFTNSNRNSNPSFEYLSALLFRVAESLGVNDGDFWGVLASNIWLGYMPENFPLDGKDTISFGGFDRQANVKYSLPERKIPSSLKEEAKEDELAKSRTAEDYLKMCDAYAPFIISVETQVGSLQFLRKDKDTPYRLIECEFKSKLWGPRASYSDKALASFILDKFGKKNGIEDMYLLQSNSGRHSDQYYWKNPSKGYAIHIQGDRVKLFSIFDDQTLYPLQKHNFITQTDLRKRFESEKPTVLDSKLEKTASGLSQQLIERRLTFEEYLKRQLGDYALMGFTGFGESLELKR